MKKQNQNKLHFAKFKVAALGRDASTSIIGGHKVVANSTRMCATTTITLTDTIVVTDTSAICENEK